MLGLKSLPLPVVTWALNKLQNLLSPTFCTRADVTDRQTEREREREKKAKAASSMFVKRISFKSLETQSPKSFNRRRAAGLIKKVCVDDLSQHLYTLFSLSPSLLSFFLSRASREIAFKSHLYTLFASPSPPPPPPIWHFLESGCAVLCCVCSSWSHFLVRFLISLGWHTSMTTEEKRRNRKKYF